MDGRKTMKAAGTVSFGIPTTTTTPAVAAAAMEPSLDRTAMELVFHQSSVLETPPVFDASTTPVFPSYDVLNSMESGLFNDIPVFDSIMESTNVVSSAIDIDPRFATTEFVPDSVHPPVASAPLDAVARPVQSFDFDHPDILMDAKPEVIVNNDPPMPIVRSCSHDHAYVNKESEDYQILCEFLTLGQEIGVVPESDDEELIALVGSFDVHQLGPRASYLDTYGDLTPLLNEGLEDANDQMQEQRADEANLVEEVAASQHQPPPNDDDASTSPWFEYPFASTQFSYPSSPEPSASPFLPPSTKPKPKSSTRKPKSRYASSSLLKDEKYWERRKKNNVASARSRKTRKERAAETELERKQLEMVNRQLKEEIAQLTRQVQEQRRRFFTVFKK